MTSTTFDTAFERLMQHEGGYVNHPDDPGGETMYGVTKRVAQQYGYTGPMKNLPRDIAKKIARQSYWEPVNADQYAPAIAFQVFDAAYNHGPQQAVKFLQQACGAKADGVPGPKTIAAVNAQPVSEVLLRFNAERLRFYANLKTFPTFGKGWTRRVAENLDAGALDA